VTSNCRGGVDGDVAEVIPFNSGCWTRSGLITWHYPGGGETLPRQWPYCDS
jgi:hypothetical protein